MLSAKPSACCTIEDALQPAFAAAQRKMRINGSTVAKEQQ
jgi:hypothetical protein